MTYINGELKNNSLPTITQLKKYIRLANIPLKDSTRDVRPLMSFLQRLPEVDGYLFGLLQSRKLAVKSYRFDIRLPLDFKITPAEEKQLAETKKRFKRANIKNLFDDIMDGILNSMSAVKLEYDNTPIGTMVNKTHTYDLTELDYSESSNNGLCELITSDKDGYYKRNELDPDIHLITKHNTINNRKGYTGSFMRSIMILSYLKYHTRWDWRDLNKRHGVPATYATHPDGISDEEAAKIIRMLDKLKSDAVALFPDWVKILFDESLKSDQTDSFDAFVNAANVEMAIALHGQNLTTEVKQGSKAAAEVHNQVDDLFILSDLTKIEEIITGQYLRQDYLLNYGEPRNDFFEFVFLKEEQEDCESNSRIIQNIYSDETLKRSLPLKKDEVYKKLGFTKPAEGDDILE